MAAKSKKIEGNRAEKILYFFILATNNMVAAQLPKLLIDSKSRNSGVVNLAIVRS